MKNISHLIDSENFEIIIVYSHEECGDYKPYSKYDYITVSDFKNVFSVIEGLIKHLDNFEIESISISLKNKILQDWQKIADLYNLIDTNNFQISKLNDKKLYLNEKLTKQIKELNDTKIFLNESGIAFKNKEIDDLKKEILEYDNQINLNIQKISKINLELTDMQKNILLDDCKQDLNEQK